MMKFLGVRAARAIIPALAVFAVGATASAQCPPGYFLNRWGRCVPLRRVLPIVRPRVCPAGYVLRGGVCVPFGVRPRLCPPGYFYFRGRCISR